MKQVLKVTLIFFGMVTFSFANDKNSPELFAKVNVFALSADSIRIATQAEFCVR